MLVNSALIFLTTVLMAGGGAVFWVIAARLATPEDVGLAGLARGRADSLALFAQLGLNIAILRTMPTSDRRAADVTTASLVVVVGGALFALAYSLLLPVTSPRLTAVLHSPATIASSACWWPPPPSTCSATACSSPSTACATTCGSTGS